jgi:hypothetical protein
MSISIPCVILGDTAVPVADTDIPDIAQAAVCHEGGAHRAVRPEYAFFHIFNFTIVKGNVDLECGAPVLAKRLAGPVDDAIADKKGARGIDLEKLVFGIIAFDIR